MSSEQPSKTEAQDSRGRPKTRIGVVTSNKMNKTIVVQCERRVKHARYGKYVTKHVKYKVHVPEQDRKSTRLNSSHPSISYAVFCLKKKTTASVSRGLSVV